MPVKFFLLKILCDTHIISNFGLFLELTKPKIHLIVGIFSESRELRTAWFVGGETIFLPKSKK